MSRFPISARTALPATLAALLLAGGVASAKTSVTFWCQFGDVYGQGVRKVADAFNKSQSRIEVKVVTVAEGNIGQEKLMSAMAAGSPPDVSTFADLLVAEFAQKKLLLPLDSYVKASSWSEKMFWPAAWDVTFYQDKQWAIPFTEDDRGLYYNKATWRELGYDPDKPLKSLEELEGLASKAFRMDGDLKYSRVGYVPWGGNWFFYGWGWLFGGQFWNAKTQKVTLNDSRLVDAMDWLRKFGQRYDVAKINRSPQSFQKGSLTMFNEGNWNLAAFKKSLPKGFDLGVTAVPGPEGRPPSTWSGIWTLVIPRGAKHPKEAWEFIRFASGSTGQEIYAMHTSQTPANIQVSRAIAPAMVKTFGDEAGTFIDMMKYSHCRPTIPVGSFLWDAANAAQDAVLAGKKSPQQALGDANKLVQLELDKVLARTKGRK